MESFYINYIQWTTKAFGLIEWTPNTNILLLLLLLLLIDSSVGLHVKVQFNVKTSPSETKIGRRPNATSVGKANRKLGIINVINLRLSLLP